MTESQSMLCGLKQVSDDNSDYDFDLTVFAKVQNSSYFLVEDGENHYQAMLLL